MDTTRTRTPRTRRQGRIPLGPLGLAVAVVASGGCAAPVADGSGDVEVRTSALETGEVTIGSMNYYQCAIEFGTCNVGSGFRYVAFGANGNYTYKSLSGNFVCVKSVFDGIDPAPGPGKACFMSNYGSNDFVTPQLALQDQTSSYDGDVAYGTQGQFVFKRLKGQFTCDDATFGIPVAGSKACYGAVPPYTRVANEDPGTNTLYGLYTTPVAFGANGKFLFKIMTGTGPTFSRQCSVADFGGDPFPGVPKDCYKLITGNLPVITSYSYLVDEGTNWNLTTGDQIGIFYGSGRNGSLLVRTAGTTGACNNNAGDPDVGFGKKCWAAPLPPPNQGSWTKLTAPFPGTQGPRIVQLLMDGSILASDAARPWTWYRLRPDTNGHYAGGTWQVSTVISRYGRTNFATGMMTNGKFFIGGGEYVKDNNGVGVNLNNKCEVFDPAAASGNGQFSDVADFPGSSYLGDGLVAPLPNGRLLVGPAAFSNQSMEFNPSNLTWGQARALPAGPPSGFSEGSFAQLQNGKIFLAENHAALFDGPSRSWSTIASWPANDPFSQNPFEGGSALTLYSGKVMITGATGFNALYDPAGGTIVNIAPTPYVPTNISLRGHMQENDQVVMPTGNVLIAATNDYYAYKFFEYNPTADRFTDVSFGGPDYSMANGNLLQTPLPDGTVLVADAGFRDMYVYGPATAQLTSFGQPTITTVTGPNNGVYTLNGTTLNGLTNGANADDEVQNYTSFPIVWLITATQTRYATVTSVSTTSIAPGASGTVTFRVPSGMVPTHGTATVKVSASGLFSSNTKTITY